MPANNNLHTFIHPRRILIQAKFIEGTTNMALLITLTITSIAGYIKMTVNEEIEALFAGLIACLGLFLSLFFAPISIKIILLAILLIHKNAIANY